MFILRAWKTRTLRASIRYALNCNSKITAHHVLSRDGACPCRVGSSMPNGECPGKRMGLDRGEHHGRNLWRVWDIRFSGTGECSWRATDGVNLDRRERQRLALRGIWLRLSR